MRGRLKDLTLNTDGTQNIVFTGKFDFRPEFERLKDCEVNAEFKKFRRKRSLDANAYAWVLIDKIAEAMQISKTEVYRNAIKNIGGVSDTICAQDAAVDKLRRGWEQRGLGWQTDAEPSKIEGCTNIVMYYGSSSYDTKQMSALIDLLIEDARELEIETATPEELERYKEEWR